MKIGINEFEYLRKWLKHTKFQKDCILVLITILILSMLVFNNICFLYIISEILKIVEGYGLKVNFSINYSLVAIITGVEYAMLICLMKIRSSKHKSLEQEFESIFEVVPEEKLSEINFYYTLSISISYGLFLLIGLYTGNIQSSLMWWIVVLCAVIIGIYGNVLFYVNYSPMILDISLYNAFKDSELKELIIQASDNNFDCVLVESQQMRGKVIDLVYSGVFTIRNFMTINDLKCGEKIELWLSKRAQEFVKEYKEFYYIVYIESDEIKEVFENNVIYVKKMKPYYPGDILTLNEVKEDQIENEYKIQVVDVFTDNEKNEWQSVTFTRMD